MNVSPDIVHVLYHYNTDQLDEHGEHIYDRVYFENSIVDVMLTEMSTIDVDSIPEINYETDDLKRLLEISDAKTRKLDRDKLNVSETTKVAEPNKILYLDENGKFPATAADSDKLNGRPASDYALQSDLDAIDISLGGIKLTGFEEIVDLDDIPTVDYEADNLLKFLQVNEAKIRKLDRDKLDKSEAVTTATANKILYLDSNGKLNATAVNADKLGTVAANQYALKDDIPSVWDVDGHLISPAGWKLWISDN